MYENDSLMTAVAQKIKEMGHTPELTEGNTLVSVDGTWVGAWVMTSLRGGKRTFRVGFGAAVESYPDPEKVGAEKLADKVLSWLSLHGEASRLRSATQLEG